VGRFQHCTLFHKIHYKILLSQKYSPGCAYKSAPVKSKVSSRRIRVSFQFFCNTEGIAKFSPLDKLLVLKKEKHQDLLFIEAGSDNKTPSRVHLFHFSKKHMFIFQHNLKILN
jgi:hypothetical protein